MEHSGNSGPVKKALKIGAVAAVIATPAILLHESSKNAMPADTETEVVRGDHTAAPSPIVSHDTLDKNITYTTKAEASAGDTMPSAAATVAPTADSVKADIEQTLANTPAAEKPAVVALEGSHIAMSFDELESSFGEVIKQALADNEKSHPKKEVTTSFQSLSIERKNGVVTYHATLEAKKNWLVSFNIHIKGSVATEGGQMVLSVPVISSKMQRVTDSANAQILPIWNTIEPKWISNISRDNGGKAVTGVRIEGDSIKVDLAPAK